MDINCLWKPSLEFNSIRLIAGINPGPGPFFTIIKKTPNEQKEKYTL